MVIGDEVTSIGSSAFKRCSGLTSITIPNSVTYIGGEAFSGCSGLTSITIPNSVISIGDGAFSGCSGLTSVTFHCKEIGSWFSRLTSITKVVIGDEVTYIDSEAFYNCTGLISITIPNSVTSIGGWAFYNCSSLTSITIPYSVTSIGSSAFEGCRGLSSVIALNTTPPAIWGSTFDIHNTATLYVPLGCKNIYSQHRYWKYFLKIVEIDIIVQGDANGDGTVNVSDIVLTINYIMGNSVPNFNMEAADLNGDGEVNVTDIVMMVSIIMDGNGGSSRRAAATSSHLVISRNNIQLRNAEAYTAAQFDINLSDGQSISNVVLNVSSDHSLYWKMVDANTYRVVVYSMTNAAFRANSDNLFTVFMTGVQNATISNELLIQAESVTSIDLPQQNENYDVYDLRGNKVRSNATDLKGLSKGIYIVNGKKVIISQ